MKEEGEEGQHSESREKWEENSVEVDRAGRGLYLRCNVSAATLSSPPDRYVLIGNHRDAWGYGASDPSSGTAQLLETARVLGKLREEGWRPRRTLVFCSWGAEEYGLIGSIEWVEVSYYFSLSESVKDSQVLDKNTFVYPPCDRFLVLVLCRKRNHNGILKKIYSNF